MNKQVYDKMIADKAKGKKTFAVLLDPDSLEPDQYKKIVQISVESKVDYFFVGGSLITSNDFVSLISNNKEYSKIQQILLPANNLHIDASADAILFLSLISGRNADLLIGQHVVSAPILKRTELEILPTGYMLVDGGRATTVSYISNTNPLPADKPSIAACTAMAGEMLGLKLIYLDSGSGAIQPVSAKMIGAVRRSVQTPIIVGGGINTVEKAMDAITAGADTIVIGNGIEKNINLLIDVAERIQAVNFSVKK